MPVTVDGLPDTLVEGDETYLVQINTGGIVGPAIAGSPAVATVTILDEDCEFLLSYVHAFMYSNCMVNNTHTACIAGHKILHVHV